MILGIIVCFYGLSHSTAPSFAPRITAVGKASAFSEKRVEKNSKFVFRFVPEAGDPVNLETQIVMPLWDNAEVFTERILRITYLNNAPGSGSNEAIEIEILSGGNTGWHDSLDARPFGLWLAIPIGGLVAGFGYIGIRFRKDDLRSAELSETEA